MLERVSEKSVIDLVNLSQYVMFSLGCPSHIYDLDKISGKIEVCLSEGGESFTALDGKEYILPKSVLIIRDEEKILSIAGIIGGESSKVDQNTKNIFIEFACFDSKKDS